MSATAVVAPSRMPVAEIKVRDGFNVRQNGGGIDELAASIELLGVLVPVIVDDDGYLIAGHRRLAAARKLGLEEIPVVIDEGNIAAAAAENIMRQQLSPAEEAQAIQRMLDAGYTSDGAAQALGMSKQLVARRLVLLAIPDDVRELWGPHGTAQASSATSVALLLEKAPGLAPHVLKMHEAAAAGDRNAANVDHLARQPEDYLRRLERASTSADNWYKVKGLPKLPKDVDLVNQQSHLAGRASNLVTGPQLAEYKKLERQLREFYIYNCELVLNSADMDAARAAGVTLQLPESDAEYIVDVGWLRERIKSDVFPRFEKKVKRAIADAAKKRNARSGKTAAAGDGKLSAAERKEQERKQRRAAAEKRWKGLARGANLDLGRALLDNLATVEITADVARLFAEASIGWRPGAAEYVRYEDRDTAMRLAARGLRYVFADWQTEVATPTKADPDRTKIEYAEIKDAEARLWKWFDAAIAPGQILGRALIIHAAARWAREEMLAQSARVYMSPVLPTAATELLEKIAARHLPASITQLADEIRTFDPDKAAV
jgi:ParB/RepB/Spo0J family partition protein